MWPSATVAETGPFARPLLPGFWSTIGGLLPPGASVDLARSALFFDGARITGPILVLVGWGAIGRQIDEVRPTIDAQKSLRSKAADLIASIQDLRLGTRLQIDNSVTWPFLSILVSWTALLFFGFGLLARLNAAAVFTLAIGALSVASAIFLILELDAPYSGILRLPPTPILEAIDALGK